MKTLEKQETNRLLMIYLKATDDCFNGVVKKEMSGRKVGKIARNRINEIK